MRAIVSEDEDNDTYGRPRMYQAFLLKQPESVHIPSERSLILHAEELSSFLIESHSTPVKPTAWLLQNMVFARA